MKSKELRKHDAEPFYNAEFSLASRKKLIGDFTPSFLLGELPQNEDTRA